MAKVEGSFENMQSGLDEALERMVGLRASMEDERGDEQANPPSARLT
jgi:hypothetical protein